MKKHLLLLCMFLFAIHANAQNASTISGRVVTPDGQPLESATVSLKGTKYSTSTNTDGYYQLSNIPAGKYTLIFSGLGFKKINKDIEVKSGAQLELNLSAQSNLKDLDEVTVTGNKPVVTSSSEYVSKMPLSNIENAQVYTGITNALIVQQKVYNLEDALRNVTGITSSFNTYGNTIDYGGISFVSRGFQTKVRAMNGLAINMATSSDVANLEKIEVIKGPSATLFGNIISSYGGLINRVTKKPYETAGGAVDISSGNYGFRRMSVDLNTPLNADKTFLSRVNVAVQNRGTFQDNGAFSKGVFVAPAFTYKLSDKVKINLNAEISHTDEGGMGGGINFTLGPSFVNGYLPAILPAFGVREPALSAILASAPTTILQTFGSNNIKDFNIDPYRSYISNDFTSKLNSLTLNAEVHYKINEQWESITSAIAGSGTSNGYNVNLILVPNEIKTLVRTLMAGSPGYGTPGADDFSRTGRTSNSSVENQQIQQNFVGDYKIGNLRNRTVIGLDYYHNKSVSLYRTFNGSLFGIPLANMFDQIAISGDTPTYYNFNKASLDAVLQKSPGAPDDYSVEQSVYSSYINNVLNITDQLIASAGIRVDRFENKGRYDGTKNQLVNGYKQTAFSPKFGLIYQPIKDKVSVFGNYQTSFTNKDDYSFDQSGFVPEQALQWETGVKTSFFDGHFTSTLSYYDIRVNHVVRQDYLHPLYQVQDGTQVSRGFEAEVLGNPIPELNIILGYAYNKSKMVKSDALVEGLRPAGSGPEHQFNFWLHYHFNETTPLNGLSIGFGGNYVGETLAVNLNPDGAIIIPDYKLFNAKLSYDKAKYSFGFRVNNLGNEKYWSGIGNIAPQMPRQYILSLAVKI